MKPKFKVGDILIRKGLWAEVFCQVIEVDALRYYRMEFLNNGHFVDRGETADRSIGFTEENYKLVPYGNTLWFQRKCLTRG